MTRGSRRPEPEQLELALHAAREALGSPEAVLRVRAGLARKLASGLTPPATHGQAGPARLPLGKGLSLLLLLGAGAGLYAALSQPPSAAVPVLPRVVEARPAPEPVRELPPVVRAESAPEPKAAEPVRRTNKLAVRAVSKPSARTEPDVDAEVALIARAQQHLRAHPAEALTLLVEHARRFPRGLLVQERETLRIDAERALGFDDEARERARQFVAQFPGSAQACPLERWLAGRPANSLDHKSEPAAVPTH